MKLSGHRSNINPLSQFAQGQPPPPGMPPGGPMGPPPGGPAPGMYPSPAPPKSGGGGKCLLIGCGAIVALVVVLAIAGVIFGGTCMDKAMEVAQVGWVSMLAPEHDEEDEERFTEAMEAVFTDELDRLGLIQWSQAYQAEVNLLNAYAADSKITLEESSSWCDVAEEKLDDQGYYDE